jgi:xanthine dehydrogenase accessory factor
MHSTDIHIIRTALDWCARGHRVVMGTVVNTWGSAPRPPGSLMVIRDDGQVAGSVSGGCIEDDLVRRVAAGELVLQTPALTVYGASADEARRFGLPCGGTVRLVLEPLGPQSQLQALLAAITERRQVLRVLDLHSGQVHLHPADHPPGADGSAADRVAFDGQQLRTLHGPGHRLLIIGGGQLSSYLAHMALMLDYRVTVCEPRTEYHEPWLRQGGVHLSTMMPDDLVLALQLDSRSAVVALTHDPKLDDLALMEALKTPAFYVGALGSVHNQSRRRERLLLFDLTPQQINRLHGPVGLDLGALTPPEIALSILAEMTALRRGRDTAQPLNRWSGAHTVCASA